MISSRRAKGCLSLTWTHVSNFFCFIPAYHSNSLFGQQLSISVYDPKILAAITSSMADSTHCNHLLCLTSDCWCFSSVEITPLVFLPYPSVFGFSMRHSSYFILPAYVWRSCFFFCILPHRRTELWCVSPPLDGVPLRRFLHNYALAWRKSLNSMTTVAKG